MNTNTLILLGLAGFVAYALWGQGTTKAEMITNAAVLLGGQHTEQSLRDQRILLAAEQPAFFGANLYT